MNVESIMSKIELFEELVVNSGFKRDLGDFVQSIQQPQNQNLIFMKDISNRVRNSLENFRNNSLDSELTDVLRDNEPFISEDIIRELQYLNVNGTIDAPEYLSQLYNVLNNLIVSINSNESEISAVKNVFEKYVSCRIDFEAGKEQGLVSLVFKDGKSTSGLKEFSRVLNRWNHTLILLHQLVKSNPPEEISLIQIQNGSIDVIFNIDIDVAVDLAKVMKTGFVTYVAYLLYKTDLARKIIESFFGNNQLVEMEKERERLMLENIGVAVRNKLKQMHEERLREDQEIDGTAIEGKLDSVSECIVDHIVKGNEVKLLTAPQRESEEDDESEEQKILKELREEAAIARESYKRLSPEDRNLLLETYAVENREVKNETEGEFGGGHTKR